MKRAIAVHDRMLAVPNIRGLLFAAQEMAMPNPLDSMGELNAFLVKAVTPDRIEFALTMLLDFYRSGALTLDQCAARSLVGAVTARDNSGKGLVDLFVYKMQLLEYLVGEFLDTLEVAPTVKVKLRMASASITNFRAMAGYFYNPNEKPVSAQWRAGWPRGAEQAFELVEVHMGVVRLPTGVINHRLTGHLFMSVCLSTPICLSVCLSVCPSVCIAQFVFLSLALSPSLAVDRHLYKNPREV